MHNINCPLCTSDNVKRKFAKESRLGENYTIYKCKSCRHEYIYPLPSNEELEKYYDAAYFKIRTDRGYNNYFSEETKAQITKVFEMNLRDINFDSFEHTLPPGRRSLDIGCAAGYFVELMKNKGWEASGIDVSDECTSFARKNLGLDVVKGDYLKTRYQFPFDLITLWATIEHLPHPELFLEKARSEIFRSGRLYLSTCRCDSSFKKLHRQKWRYYNVPEHIHYFSVKSLTAMLQSKGFSVDRYFTYGSGFAPGGTLRRKTADFAAKHFGMGDMIVLSARPI